MNERSSFPGVTAMQPNEAPSSIATPQTLNDLQVWIHDTLKLSPPLEAALLAAIDSVFILARHCVGYVVHLVLEPVGDRAPYFRLRVKYT